MHKLSSVIVLVLTFANLTQAQVTKPAPDQLRSDFQRLDALEKVFLQLRSLVKLSGALLTDWLTKEELAFFTRFLSAHDIGKEKQELSSLRW